jgi:hypothetical protein
MRIKTLLAALAAAAAGCSQSSQPSEAGEGSTTPTYERAEGNSRLGEAVVPVRIGEFGPNFAACHTRGTTRNLREGNSLPVLAAHYEAAGQVGELQTGANFFVCSRSHDQRWYGIVYDEGGRTTERCGLNSPVASRRDYEGPCQTGWVPSSYVRLVSGIQQQQQEPAPSPAPEAS